MEIKQHPSGKFSTVKFDELVEFLSGETLILTRMPEGSFSKVTFQLTPYNPTGISDSLRAEINIRQNQISKLPTSEEVDSVFPEVTPTAQELIPE